MALVGLEEGLAELRSFVGQELPRPSAWTVEATPDAIRHFAHGIGDDNPLWCDPEYAAKGPYGEPIASPTFYFAVDDATVNPGLHGYQGLYMGATWKFVRPVRAGTPIRSRARFVKFEPKQTQYGGLMILGTSEITYTDAGGNVLAVFTKMSGRVVPPEGKASGGIRYGRRPFHTYSDAELAKIRAAQAAYRRRGAEPRCWEDVRPDEPVGPLVIGPLTAVDIAAYYAGAGYTGALPNSVEKVRARRKLGAFHEVSHSSGIYRDATGAIAYPSRAHLDERLAHQLGMPNAFDYGNERTSFVARMMTDWAGDAGWLDSLYVQIRRPKVLGDTTWFAGRVAEPVLPDRPGHVRIEFTGLNQQGDLISQGWAVVRLPTAHPNPGRQ